MNDRLLAIRQFLANASTSEVFTVKEISEALNESELEIAADLCRLSDAGIVTGHKLSSGKRVFKKASAFIARRIVPIFAGTPEWIVETFDGRLCCWCPSEFDAKVIADGLNRS